MPVRWSVAATLYCILQMCEVVGTSGTQANTSIKLPDGVDVFKLMTLVCQDEHKDAQIYTTGPSCNATWDGITCWPPAPAGTLVSMPCPAQLRGIQYDTTEPLRIRGVETERHSWSRAGDRTHAKPGHQLTPRRSNHSAKRSRPLGQVKNATKLCYKNGTWARKANYIDNCHPISASSKSKNAEMERHLENAKLLNNVGHAISLVCLVIAFGLFAYLRSIRCTRNNIHWNLVATFILRNTSWFIIQEVVDVQTVQDNSWHCRVAVTLYNYFQVTNFFWMFVEGLYLHIMIAHAFGTERIKFWVYALIGVPVPIIVPWMMVKIFLKNERCWIDTSGGLDHYDFIYHGPTILVLLVNFVILGNIVRILVLKLRASPNNLDTTHYSEYSADGIGTTQRMSRVSYKLQSSIKAVKATVVLLPLLGITYILFFVHPSGKGTSKLFFIYFNSFLQSFQGCFVSIIYCFTNTEVQTTIKRHVDIWRDQHWCTGASPPSKHMPMTSITAGPSNGNKNVSIRDTSAYEKSVIVHTA
ncbi:Corticotropin-releasing factor receptor 2 [Branchiostoma belcheri]|nr:Corticotropin-releasing factor receptor 2 [Branchiostoma belcheri]